MLMQSYKMTLLFLFRKWDYCDPNRGIYHHTLVSDREGVWTQAVLLYKAYHSKSYETTVSYQIYQLA